VRDESRRAVSGHVLHQHPHPLRADGEIHRAADRGRAFGRTPGPVGEIARGGDLVTPEHAEVDVATADHREAVGVMEEGAPGPEGHGLFARVDEPGIHRIGRGARPHTENPVLAHENHLALRGHELRHRGRQADAEIHDPALRNIRRDLGGHLEATEEPRGHAQGAPRSTATTRLT
jgi:hypothetical protein